MRKTRFIVLGLLLVIAGIVALAAAMPAPFARADGQTFQQHLRAFYLGTIRPALGELDFFWKIDSALRSVIGTESPVPATLEARSDGGSGMAQGRNVGQPVDLRGYPAGGEPVLAGDGISAFRLKTSVPANVEAKFIESSKGTFSRALRVSTRRALPNAWDVQLLAIPQAGLKPGDVGLLSLWVRNGGRGLQTEASSANVYVQRDRAPYKKLAAFAVIGTDDWRQVFLSFKSAEEIPAGELAVSIHLGRRAQEIEIGGIVLLNYHQSRAQTDLPTTRPTYEGRAANAAWRKTAAERIRLLRMADIEVRVVDGSGRPRAGVPVNVRMQRHAFDFGSVVVADRLCGTDPDSLKYQQLVESSYTKAVFENELKINGWREARANAARMAKLDCAFDWLQKRNIKVRGHYASQAALHDEEIPVYRSNPRGFLSGIKEQMRDKLPRVGARVTEWDAVNHLVGWGATLADSLDKGIYADLIMLAREVSPATPMWVNETDVLEGGHLLEAYEKAILDLIKRGARPDGIGFMGHFDEMSLTSPEYVYATMDRFALLARNLQITELDVDTADDRLQADYLRDVMTIAFSHSAVKAVVLWGFWESQHWKPGAALYRANWEARPAAREWRDLVFSTWWTDVKGATGADGSYRVRGFLGDYRIAAGDGPRQAVANKSIAPGNNLIEIRAN